MDPTPITATNLQAGAASGPIRSPATNPGAAVSRMPAADKEKAVLKQVCSDIEGIFLSILLKEGLQSSAMKEEAETPGGHEQIQGYAIEQAARDLGEQSSFGIADALYEELSRLK